MPTSTNRTKWPVKGGAISIQPGWFQGHSKAFFYINLGLGAVPPNMSHVMVSPFEIIGPSSEPYPGTFCLPQVPLPTNITVNVGDLATIQVIETAIHGAALYNVCNWSLELNPISLSQPTNTIFSIPVRRHRIRRPCRRRRSDARQLLQFQRHLLRTSLHNDIINGLQRFSSRIITSYWSRSTSVAAGRLLHVLI